MNLGKLFNHMIFYFLICDKGMVRLYFSVYLDHIFFRYTLDPVYSHPSSSGNTTMDYVSWQGTVTEGFNVE